MESELETRRGDVRLKLSLRKHRLKDVISKRKRGLPSKEEYSVIWKEYRSESDPRWGKFWKSVPSCGYRAGRACADLSPSSALPGCVM